MWDKFLFHPLFALSLWVNASRTVQGLPEQQFSLLLPGGLAWRPLRSIIQLSQFNEIINNIIPASKVKSLHQKMPLYSHVHTYFLFQQPALLH